MRYGIRHFSTCGDTKASVVERFNRTLKQRLYRHFTDNLIKLNKSAFPFSKAFLSQTGVHNRFEHVEFVMF